MRLVKLILVTVGMIVGFMVATAVYCAKERMPEKKSPSADIAVLSQRINTIETSIQQVKVSQDNIAQTLLQESQNLRSAIETLRQESAMAERVSATLFGRDAWSAAVKKVVEDKNKASGGKQ